MSTWALRNAEGRWFDGKGWTDDSAGAHLFGSIRAANDMAAIWATPGSRPELVSVQT